MLEYLTAGLLMQLFINGILFGTMYGLAAIGLSLIFGTMRIIFLAQGAVIVLMAYACYWLFTLLHVDPYVSTVIIAPAALLLGGGLYQALFRRAQKMEDKNVSLLIAVGLMFLLENFMAVVWTPNPRSISTSYTSSSLAVGGLDISFTRLMGFVMAILSTAVVTLFLKKTLVGKAVRAASEDIEAARLVGINPHWVNTMAFAIGIGLSGIAGIAISTTYPFDPYFGFVFSLKAMIALALGGLGSVSGALLGGIILGLLESWAAFFVSGGWADAMGYAVFLLVLLFKPEGLFVRSIKKA
ncbi:MAG: branched-chain amino acid ABC transporter permease [Syntrophorhabdales bacterium]|jgi:branched-chain amino acid transport system permease protein